MWGPPAAPLKEAEVLTALQPPRLHQAWLGGGETGVSRPGAGVSAPLPGVLRHTGDNHRARCGPPGAEGRSRTPFPQPFSPFLPFL